MSQAAKNVAVLGSTGSIGTSALDVIATSQGRLRAVALSAHQKLSELVAQARRFQPHLTIGRVKHEPPEAQGELTALLQNHAHFDADLSVIDEVVVFASFLGRSGANHEALGRCELGS